MEISRRAFLMSTVAMIVAPAVHGIAGTTSADAVIVTGPSRIGTAWAVGTSGEFNWHRVFAETREEAYRIWLEDGDDETEISEAILDESTVRVEEWDYIEKLQRSDWIRAHMGAHCSRCDEETYADSGARIIGDDVVCEECVTFGDRCAIDEPDELVDDLINFFDDHDGPDGARAFLMAHGWWDDLPVESWNAAMEWLAKNP